VDFIRFSLEASINSLTRIISLVVVGESGKLIIESDFDAVQLETNLSISKTMTDKRA
jgi:hypothetical protein